MTLSWFLPWLLSAAFFFGFVPLIERNLNSKTPLGSGLAHPGCPENIGDLVAGHYAKDCPIPLVDYGAEGRPSSPLLCFALETVGRIREEMPCQSL